MFIYYQNDRSFLPVYALYGLHAIAGVVNLVTRKNFDGVEISVDYATDDETGNQNDLLVSGIMGITCDRGNIVVSASYLNREPLQYFDRREDFGASGISTLGQPGRYVALGAITLNPIPLNPSGSESFGPGRDPGCDHAIDGTGTGTLGGLLCLYDFS
ncbi:MAG: hypothetical protein ABGY96_17880 [bacterium]|nr:hypothetical protein [Gammaproteobacteria bacterium]HIL95704.1 hypothetical protein [Pseudomonadales bacterium]